MEKVHNAELCPAPAVPLLSMRPLPEILQGAIADGLELMKLRDRPLLGRFREYSAPLRTAACSCSLTECSSECEFR